MFVSTPLPKRGKSFWFFVVFATGDFLMYQSRHNYCKPYLIPYVIRPSARPLVRPSARPPSVYHPWPIVYYTNVPYILNSGADAQVGVWGGVAAPGEALDGGCGGA